MKKYLACILVTLLLIMASLAGCGGDSTVAPEGGSGEQTGETYVMRIAANLPPGTYEVDIHEEFKRILEEKVGSQIKVEIYPAGQLGAPPAVIEGIQSGTVHSYLTPLAFLGGIEPGTQVLDLPGFFETTDQAYHILNNSDALDDLNKSMEEKGFLPLGYLVLDYRSIIAPFPVNKLEDLKGKRIRTLTTPPQQLEFEAFGGSGVPVDPGEVYTALQQGMVDGVCSGIHFFSSMKLYEVAEYFSNTRHAPFMSVLAVSKSWVDSLPAELQEAVKEAAAEVMPWGYELAKGYEADALQMMIDEGLIVVEATDELLAEIWEASKPVHEKILQDNPAWTEMYEKLKVEIENWQ